MIFVAGKTVTLYCLL